MLLSLARTRMGPRIGTSRTTLYVDCIDAKSEGYAAKDSRHAETDTVEAEDIGRYQ